MTPVNRTMDILTRINQGWSGVDVIVANRGEGKTTAAKMALNQIDGLVKAVLTFSKSSYGEGSNENVFSIRGKEDFDRLRGRRFDLVIVDDLPASIVKSSEFTGMMNSTSRLVILTDLRSILE